MHEEEPMQRFIACKRRNVAAAYERFLGPSAAALGEPWHARTWSGLVRQIDQPEEHVVRRRDEAAPPDAHPQVGNVQVTRHLVQAAELVGGPLQQAGMKIGHRTGRPRSADIVLPVARARNPSARLVPLPGTAEPL